MAGEDENRRRRFEAEALPHRQALYRTGLHLTHSADDACDLIQDTYLRAYRAFDQFTPGTNCKAWLFTIMYSIFNTQYRKAQRELNGMQILALEGQYEQWLAQADADPAGQVMGWSDSQVAQALRQLPEEFRSVVLFVDVGELSYEAAAAALDCPVGTVRSRLFRARKLLFAALQTHAQEMGYSVTQEPT